MRRKKWKCPECGNTDRRTMQTNGEDLDSYYLGVLCEARVPAATHHDLWQLKSVTELHDYDPATGTATCGMQFDPNAEE